MRGYFNYNSSAPLEPRMRDRILEWVDADPALLSGARVGASPAWLESARTTIAGGPGLEEYQIAFTSGATESNRLALEFLYHRYMGSGLTDASFLRNKVLIFALEHSSIYEQAKYLRNLGYDVLLIPCDQNGVADVDFIRDNAGTDTVLVSMMYASGEIGAVQPVEEVGSICEEFGIHFHCDASQIPGKYSPSWFGSRANTISLSGHKFGGLAGSGALLYRKQPPVALLFGEELNVRPGMPNRLGIQCMAQAWAWSQENLSQKLASMKTLRDLFERELRSKLPGISFIGQSQNRLANTSAILLSDVPPDRVMTHIAKNHQEVGFLCGKEGLHSPSRVLLELGNGSYDNSTALCISLGASTTSAEISMLIDNLSSVLNGRNS